MGERRESGLSATSKTYLTIIAVLVVVLLIVWVWKGTAVGKVERQLEEEREAAAGRMRDALTLQTEEMLGLAGVPLGWSVRAALLKENYEQVQDYLNRLVKEPHVTRIVLAGQENTIRVATDKKLEGQAATAVFPAEAVAVTEAKVLDGGEQEIILAVPVVSYDARLGTLIVAYSRDSIESKIAASAEPAEPEPEPMPEE